MILIRLAFYCIGSYYLFRKTYAAVWHDLYGDDQTDSSADSRDF